MNTSGHVAASGSTIDSPADGKGVFIYRSATGTGTNTWTEKIRWNYGVDGLLNTDAVELRVFGIEMVYAPTGSFYVGDGGSTVAGNFEARVSNTPFQITSEGAITLGGNVAGCLGNNNASGMYVSSPYTDDDFSDATSQTLPAAFPKGYNKFYIMKYEVSQEQYAEFLNTLTYTQQANHTASAPALLQEHWY